MYDYNLLINVGEFFEIQSNLLQGRGVPKEQFALSKELVGQLAAHRTVALTSPENPMVPIAFVRKEGAKSFKLHFPSKKAETRV